MSRVLSDGVLGKNYNPSKSWLIMTLSWWCTPLKCQKLNICLYCQKRSLVPNDSPTQVFYPHFIHCF